MARFEKATDLYLTQWLETDLSTKAINASDHDLIPSKTLHEFGIVTELYRSCCAQLSRLSTVLASPSRRCRILVTDIRSKLIIFGGSLESGELESCLNADDELKEDILLILYEIGRILAYGMSPLRCEPQSWPNPATTFSIDKVCPDVFRHASEDVLALRDDDTSTKLKDFLVSVKSDLDTESDSDTSEGASGSEDDKQSDGSANGRTNERHCVRSLAQYVDLLMSLYPTLEQAFRDKHRQPLVDRPWPIQKISVTGAALPYVHNVRDKFPAADKDLAERLGEANWQRHTRLRSVAMKSEIPESFFKPISQFRDSALGDSLASKSAKAASVASHSSYMSSIEGGEGEHFRVPNLPAGAVFHKSFECPYCGESVSTRNRIAWK